MIKQCGVCGQEIHDGDRVHVGALTTFKEIPSKTAWAINKPDQYTFLNHAECEGLE